MKKIVALFCLVAVVFSVLSACGEKLPIEKAQAKAVEIGEQYLNFELTAEEARNQLKSIKVPETPTGKGQLYLEADIAALAYNILYGDSYERIEEKVDFMSRRDYTE